MKPSVLVIESEPWLGDQYQESLKNAGFTVLRASNGYTAIDIVDDKEPTAIVMSLLLDGPGAVGLLHELQSYTDTASIPIIVCSNLPDLQIEELRPYGVRQLIDSRVMKPSDIVSAVRSSLA
ncbi:MAG: hypothetical protein WAW80_02180 [Candidatus Saccharimonadales bacterium]